MEGVGVTEPLGKTKNSHDNLLIWIVQLKLLSTLKKLKAVTLVKWVTKKGIGKIQEERQQAISGHDN